MEKMMRKIIIFMLVTMLLFVSACGNPDNEDDGTIKDTDILLVNNGASDFSVLIPKDASNDIRTAANELTYFFNEATGVNLDIISDENGFKADAKYISLGNTALFKAGGISINRSELGGDGYRIITKGDDLYLIGGDDSGTLFSVYEFLEKTFDIEIYAKNEIRIPAAAAKYLKDFNITNIPDIARRAISLHQLTRSAELRNRMRLHHWEDDWTYFSHSYFKILPPAVYMEAHPDWYTSDKMQLCLTNEDMIAELTKNVIELVKNNPQDKYIMLGQEDDNVFCGCDTCDAEVSLYKESGTAIRFTNKVARSVQAWINANQPGRELKIVTFAYQKTTLPPVKFNSSSNKFELLDSSVLADSNVGILYAPIRAIYSRDIMDTKYNAPYAEAIEGWKVAAPNNLFLYLYHVLFQQYFIGFNNWSTVRRNFEIASEIGSPFVYFQASRDAETACFQELRIYVQSKLMWDTSLDPRALIRDFIKNYYKEAAPYVQEYYDYVLKHDALLEANQGIEISIYEGDKLMDKKYFTKQYLDKCVSILEKAYAAADTISDPILRELIKDRVNKETLSTRYLLLQLYFDSFTTTEVIQEINNFESDCSKHGILGYAELYRTTIDRTIPNLIASWRAKVL